MRWRSIIPGDGGDRQSTDSGWFSEARNERHRFIRLFCHLFFRRIFSTTACDPVTQESYHSINGGAFANIYIELSVDDSPSDKRIVRFWHKPFLTSVNVLYITSFKELKGLLF